MTYSPEILAEAERHPTLGAEYFAAREHVERFLKNWREEHAEELAQAIMKPVLDIVQEKVWDAFRDHLLSDSEYNAQGAMARMVEDSVKALIGGDKWANVKYISPPASRSRIVSKPALPSPPISPPSHLQTRKIRQQFARTGLASAMSLARRAFRPRPISRGMCDA
jgi:hypothetical protein